MILERRQAVRDKRPFLWLAVVVGAALFPYGWLATRWHFFALVSDVVFGTEAAHIVAHFVLFTGLATAVLRLLPPRWRWLCWPLLLGIGLTQEILQLATFKLRPFAGPEWFDLVVDMLGVAVAWWLMSVRQLRIGTGGRA